MVNGMTRGNASSKAIAILALLLVMLVGTGYALWSGNLLINGVVNSGELDWAFSTSVSTLDHGPDWNGDPEGPCFNAYPAPEGKDVGSSSYQLLDTDLDGDYDTLNVTLNNVYPLYLEDISFHVFNDGTIPLKIWKVVLAGNEYYANTDFPVYVDLNGDGYPDIRVCWGDNFGLQLHPGDTAEISLEVIVLQPAPQGAQLSFTISLIAVQWNEYSAP